MWRVLEVLDKHMSMRTERSDALQEEMRGLGYYAVEWLNGNTYPLVILRKATTLASPLDVIKQRAAQGYNRSSLAVYFSGRTETYHALFTPKQHRRRCVAAVRRDCGVTVPLLYS